MKMLSAVWTTGISYFANHGANANIVILDDINLIKMSIKTEGILRWVFDNYNTAITALIRSAGVIIMIRRKCNLSRSYRINFLIIGIKVGSVVTVVTGYSQNSPFTISRFV